MSTDRRKILLQQFSDIDANHDQYLTREELFLYLDRKCPGGAYDRNVAEQLFERMDKNYDGRVTVDEFVTVFLEAEDILQSKIEKSKESIKEFTQRRQETLSKLEQVRKSEKLNRNGIMDGSTVEVILYEAQGLPDFAEYSLKVVVGNQEAECNPSDGTNHPIWNEIFRFEIKDGGEDINLYLIKISGERRETVGQCIIPLMELQDQHKHENWRDILVNNYAPAKLYVSAQWLFSRVQYLNTILREWDDQIKQTQTLKDEYEQDLAALREPFTHVMRTAENRSRGARNDGPSLMAFENDRDLGELGIGTTFDISKINHPSDRWVVFTNYALLLVAFLTTLVNIYRSDFLDLAICLGVVLHLILKKFRDEQMKWLLYALLGSIVQDIFWLVLYTEHYWHSARYSLDSGLEARLKRFTIIMSYLLLIAKLPLLYAIWKLAYTAGNPSSTVSRQSVPASRTPEGRQRTAFQTKSSI